jgi:hypothetical protein
MEEVLCLLPLDACLYEAASAKAGVKSEGVGEYDFCQNQS